MIFLIFFLVYQLHPRPPTLRCLEAQFADSGQNSRMCSFLHWRASKSSWSSNCVFRSEGCAHFLLPTPGKIPFSRYRVINSDFYFLCFLSDCRVRPTFRSTVMSTDPTVLGRLIRTSGSRCPNACLGLVLDMSRLPPNVGTPWIIILPTGCKRITESLLGGSISELFPTTTLRHFCRLFCLFVVLSTLSKCARVPLVLLLFFEEVKDVVFLVSFLFFVTALVLQCQH